MLVCGIKKISNSSPMMQVAKGRWLGSWRARLEKWISPEQV